MDKMMEDLKKLRELVAKLEDILKELKGKKKRRLENKYNIKNM